MHRLWKEGSGHTACSPPDVLPVAPPEPQNTLTKLQWPVATMAYLKLHHNCPKGYKPVHEGQEPFHRLLGLGVFDLLHSIHVAEIQRHQPTLHILKEPVDLGAHGKDSAHFASMRLA